MGYAPDVYRLLTDHEISDQDDDQLYFTNLFIDEYQDKVSPFFSHLLTAVRYCALLESIE